MKFISLLIMAVSLLALLATCVWLAKRNSITFLANVAEGTHSGSITKLTDAAITARHLLYKLGTDAAHVALSGAADLPWGTIDDEASAAEAPVAVQLLGKGSSKRMVASAAIDAGVAVFAAASGKVAATGSVVVGISLSAATTDGDIIEVVDVAPVTISNPGVAASTFNAHTILQATADNTPVALTVGEQAVVGRVTSGNIVALTAAQLWTILNDAISSRLLVATPVAAAGSTVADAGQLGTADAVFITSDGAAKGVKLPTGVAGMVIEVVNNSATAAELYAASGGTVNALAPDASVVVPASKGLRCFCAAADTWVAFDMAAKATAS